MANQFYGFEDDEPPSGGRDHLFLWTVFILLLIGAAFACWLGSFYVFGHPEQPRSYAILKKLKKLDPPRRFEVTAAPAGEFLTAQRLFERYSKYERLQLEEENAQLMRNFIKNYKETKKMVPYVTGKFDVVETHELKPTELFSTGVVAIAAADDFSQVVIEQIFTTSPENMEAAKASLKPGLPLRLERTKDLAAVIHIERTDDGRMLFTTMPLLYGSWGVKGLYGNFSLEPPTDINLNAEIPVVQGPAFVDAMKRYVERRRAKPGIEAVTGEKTEAPPQPELVRVDTAEPGSNVPATGAMPEIPVATPIPLPTPKRGSVVAVRSTPLQIIPGLNATSPRVAATTTTPFPRLAMNAPPATPYAREVSPSVPVTPMTEIPNPAATPGMARPGVPLKPFIGSAGAPGVPATGNANWRTYSRGQQPPGRAITPAEATAMADRGGEIAERLYLRGDFVVTASRDNQAVLRAPAGVGESSKNGVSAARIIVEFPPSALPPAEGSTLSRDESEGFEVREVRRGSDGQVNIFVREITRGG